MVGFGKFQNTDFVRLVTINSVLKEENILAFFKNLEAYVSKHLLKNVS